MTLPIGNVPQIPFQLASGGLRTEFGSYVPPGGSVVAYVHHLGAPRLTDITAATTVPVVHKTLNAALRACRSGFGDTVYVLPGHAENISVADQMSNLVAGSRIIGLGHGNLRPTFTWTAAGATFLLDQANVMLSNLRLLMDPGTGGVTVAAPITISAAGCVLDNLLIRMGTDVNNKPTIGITTTAAADDTVFSNLDIYSALSTVAITTAIRIVGGSRMRMVRCNIAAGTSAAAVGVVQMLTTAPTAAYIDGCAFANTLATSSHAFTGMAGASGVIQNCVACVGAATAAGQGFNTLGNMYPGGNLWVALDDGASAARSFPTVA
jgi:hypothetical protein